MNVKIKDIPNVSHDLPFIENILSGAARYISWIFVKTPLSGADITFISMAFAIGASILALYGQFLWSFLFFFIFIMLDHVDGQVARVKKQSGKGGVYLDSRAHFIVEPLYLMAIGIGAGINQINKFDSLKEIGAIFIISGVMTGLFYLMRQTMKTGDLGSAPIRKMKEEKNIFGKINYFLFDFLRVNNPVGLMFWGIIFGYAGYTICIYTVMFGFNTIYCFLKTWRNLESEDINDRLNVAA